jgi:hypothetical protein
VRLTWQRQQCTGHLKCAWDRQGASDDTVAATLAPSPDDPEPLSDDEIKEKEKLMASGFSNWNRRDFNAFVRACEKVAVLSCVFLFCDGCFRTLMGPREL